MRRFLLGAGKLLQVTPLAPSEHCSVGIHRHRATCFYRWRDTKNSPSKAVVNIPAGDILQLWCLWRPCQHALSEIGVQCLFLVPAPLLLALAWISHTCTCDPGGYRGFPIQSSSSLLYSHLDRVGLEVAPIVIKKKDQRPNG